MKKQAMKNSLPQSGKVSKSQAPQYWALMETSWTADAWFVLCTIWSFALKNVSPLVISHKYLTV